MEAWGIAQAVMCSISRQSCCPRGFIKSRRDGSMIDNEGTVEQPCGSVEGQDKTGKILRFQNLLRGENFEGGIYC